MLCRAIQNRRVMVVGSDKTWSTEEGMVNHFSILALRTHEQYEKAKIYDTERLNLQVGRCPIWYWGRVEK